MTIESQLDAILGKLEEIDVKLGIGLGLIQNGGGGAAFSPDSVSNLIAWYDPSDLSTMWQDTGGTTPAAVNSAVARIDDKSGNGFHLTQATGANQPILRQSGSIFYLDGDGTDVLSVANGVTGLTGPDYTFAVAYRYAGGTTNANMLVADTTTGSRRAGVQIVGSGATFRSFDRGNNGITIDTVVGSQDGVDAVGVLLQSGAPTATVVQRLSGTEIFSGTRTQTAPTVDSAGMAVHTPIGRNYGALVYAQALSGADLTAVENYLAGKAGISL